MFLVKLHVISVGKCGKFFVMEFFIGEYISKIDEKYRTSFPPKFRKLFDEKELIVQKDSDRDCLILFTVKMYEQLPKIIKDRNSYAVSIDTKGRISIPKQYRKTMKVKSILFKGAEDHIELWQEEEKTT